MPLNHIVPKMLLRRFADDGRLMALPRMGGPPIPMSVTKACAETDFYKLELESEGDLAFSADFIEDSLSYFESKAAPIIDRLVNDDFRLGHWDRFYLTLFLALQLARGWAFRRDLSDVMTEAARAEVEARATSGRIADWLASRGERADVAAVTEFRERLFEGGFRMVGSDTAYIQAMLYVVFEQLHPRLFLDRRIRVVRFPEPVLMTSDQPAVLWAPRSSLDTNPRPLGVATADAVWLPLDRRHALSLLRSGNEGIVDSGRIRADQINQAVAEAATRWIFQHPADDLIDSSKLPLPDRFVTETVGVSLDREEIRVRKRILKRPPRAKREDR